MSFVQKVKNVKRREPKTSRAQYEIYLTEMETNQLFRNITMDPAQDPDVTKNLWQYLANKLNDCECGPTLVAADWRTRFANWKNSTRAKYRSEVANLNQTKAGTTKLHLTGLEARGLNIWGMATQKPSLPIPFTGVSETVSDDEEVQQPDPANGTEEIQLVLVEENGSIKEENGPESEPEDVKKTVKIRCSDLAKAKQKYKIKPYPQNSCLIKKIRKEVSEVCSKSAGNEFRRQEEKNRLETVRLKFEIAKYKFENPGFQFSFEEAFSNNC